MADDDPSKRCFHCLLTDSPGVNGEIGQITPALLAILFAPCQAEKSRSKKRRKAAPETEEESNLVKIH